MDPATGFRAKWLRRGWGEPALAVRIAIGVAMAGVAVAVLPASMMEIAHLLEHPDAIWRRDPRDFVADLALLSVLPAAVLAPFAGRLPSRWLKGATCIAASVLLAATVVAFAPRSWRARGLSADENDQRLVAIHAIKNGSTATWRGYDGKSALWVEKGTGFEGDGLLVGCFFASPVAVLAGEWAVRSHRRRRAADAAGSVDSPGGRADGF